MRFHRWCLSLLVALFGATALARSASGELVLVRDGRSEARIVVPPGAPAAVWDGLDTLRHYIREISGADLPVAPNPLIPG